MQQSLHQTRIRCGTEFNKTTKNAGVWKTISNNTTENLPECIRTIKITTTISIDKSTTFGRTLVRSYIRRFLAKHQASLKIECIPESTYERLGDAYIMDVVCEPETATEMDRTRLKYYTNAEINQVYYCKSYLNVKRISDLCTADGDFILPSIAKGERSIKDSLHQN